MAGRHLPIKRTLAAALVAAAVAAGQASAAGEWTVSATPSSAGAQSDAWQVEPAGGSWTVGPAVDLPVEPPSPGEILDQFIASTLPGAAPPVPPTAAAASVEATTDVAIDENAPEVVALRAAEAELERIDADLADVRSQLELAPEDQLDALTTREGVLEEQATAAAGRVDELLPPVEKLRQEAAARAAQQVTAASPFATLPGLSFAPVSSTVPVIDANLSAQLDSYLAGKGSPLAGHGATFVYQSTAVGLDPRLLVAISGAETSFGTYGPSQRIYNPFGMGPGIVYPSWDDGIAAAARNLGGRLYKGSDLFTIAQIQRRWAPNGAGNDPTNLNSHWVKNVSRYYVELGGDAAGTVFTDRTASQIAIPVAPAVAPGIQGTVAAPAAYGPGTAVPGGGQGKGPAAVQFAVTFIGTRYQRGGASPSTGFDHSGLIQYVYQRHGVTLPRVAGQQAAVGSPISPQNLTPGDVVFFADRNGTIHHEGLYIGKGYFVHSPQTGDVVKVSSLSEPYYASQYAGARRY